MQQTGTLAVAPAPPATERLLSADEFMALPLNLKLYELVRGKLVKVPMTGYEHGEIETNIIRLLDRHSLAAWTRTGHSGRRDVPAGAQSRYAPSARRGLCAGGPASTARAAALV